MSKGVWTKLNTQTWVGQINELATMLFLESLGRFPACENFSLTPVNFHLK